MLCYDKAAADPASALLLAHEGKWQRAVPSAIWEAFASAVDASLAAHPWLLQPNVNPRDDGSIFVAIGAYRDVTCSDTVRKAFAMADRPELVRIHSIA